MVILIVKILKGQGHNVYHMERFKLIVRGKGHNGYNRKRVILIVKCKCYNVNHWKRVTMIISIENSHNVYQGKELIVMRYILRLIV